MTSKLVAERLSNSGAVSCDPPLCDSTIQSLRVFKEVCTTMRSSLMAGSNEVVSPTAVSRELIKDTADKLSASCPNGNGALHEDASSSRVSGQEASCPFVESAVGWTIEYGGRWCEVSAVILASYCGG